MASWLLTWGKWEWDSYDEDCTKTPLKDFTWSCRSKNVKTGDEFYLIKLGKLPRGIIAHGTIEDTSQYGHWDEDKAGHQINYIIGKCDTLLNYKTQDILDVSILDRECPEQYWHPQSSGIRIKDEVLPRLHELWEEVTGYLTDNPQEENRTVIIEGTKKTIYTTIYERNPKVRRDFLKGKHLMCEVCGFDF